MFLVNISVGNRNFTKANENELDENAAKWNESDKKILNNSDSEMKWVLFSVKVKFEKGKNIQE